MMIKNKYNNFTFKKVISYNDFNIFNFMQSVNKNLNYGMEFIKFDDKMIFNSITRFENKDNILTFSFGSLMSVNYYRRLNKFFSLASEACFDQKVDASVGLCLQTNKANVNVVCKGRKVNVLVENYILNGAKVSLSSELDVLSGKQNYGIGFSLEQ